MPPRKSTLVTHPKFRVDIDCLQGEVDSLFQLRIGFRRLEEENRNRVYELNIDADQIIVTLEATAQGRGRTELFADPAEV